MLLAAKFSEIFSKLKGHFLISRSFVLKVYIFAAITNKKLLPTAEFLLLK